MTSDNDRLRAVFLKRSKISQREFGERYGIGTAGMVNQLLLGRRPVSLAAAVKFAEGLGCAIDDFSPELAAFARKAASFTHEIETDIDSAIHPNRIPVLTGEEMASRSRGKEDEPAGWTLTDHRMAEGSFALRIEDTQMEPHFTAGDIVIIEPIAPAAGGCVAALPSGAGRAVFMQYSPKTDPVSGKTEFDLLPSNNLYPVLHSTEGNIRILGVMTEHRSYRRKR